ncbi:large uncharacterized low complexity [Cryptosporidium xiaoi]|uniref:Large uncharacterized low complexity n=1 Tax=Cryptosporidium xiaoi TaxID=659607 RepID=A0AAV9XXM6_9CRYT
MSAKNAKVSSLKNVYGDKLASFLESSERCYSNLLNNSEFPELIWVKLQYEKENFLKNLVSSGLKLSDETNEDIEWRNITELLINSELINEYPISLPYSFVEYNRKFKLLSEHQKYSTVINNFSPRWGVNAGKLNNKKSSSINKDVLKRFNDKNMDYLFNMDEKQWIYLSYEVIILCKDLVQRNLGEIKLNLTRLEESKIRKIYSEEKIKSRIINKNGNNEGMFRKSFTDEKIENNTNTPLKQEYLNDNNIKNLHSKLTRDYENLKTINCSLRMFAEMVRISFGIDYHTHYMISRLMSRSDHGGMGFYSSDIIHPLDTRYRILLLLESWNKADTVNCDSTIWEKGKLRIKPGGAPRIMPKITNSKNLIDDNDFRDWINRQIHLIYSNLAFKLQRILLFISPGWLHYMPGDIDLKNMDEYRKNYWLNNKGDKLSKNTEFSSSGIKKVLGKNPQLLYEYLIESISILSELKTKIENGVWGDLIYLKDNSEKVNGKNKLIRLLKLTSAIERLDYAIRRDFSNNTKKDKNLLTHIDSYSVNKNKVTYNDNTIDNGNGEIYKTQKSLSDLFETTYNKREYIYNNEYIKDSIEEKLLKLPKLSSYWMYEIHIIHTIINCLMKVNVLKVDQNNQEFGDLSSMGLHLYSPFITRCILFIGYLLENGIYDLEQINDNTITKTGVVPLSTEAYSLYLVSNIWKCYNNYMKIKSMNSNMNNKFEKGENKLVHLFFSVLKLILTDFPKYISHTNIMSLVGELNDEETENIKKINLIKEPSNSYSRSLSGSNIKSRIQSNSKEFLRKISKYNNNNNNNNNNNSNDITNSFNYSDEENDDIYNLTKFSKINNYISTNKNYFDLISQPILKYSDKYWFSPDWMLSLLGQNKAIEENEKKRTLNNSYSKSLSKNINSIDVNNEDACNQFWKVFGISLTTSSRFEKIYNDVLLRRLNTLIFRSEIFSLFQNYFELENPEILKLLSFIIKKINKSLILENIIRELNYSHNNQLEKKTIESDKILWIRYCNYCILRSNEKMIRDLFEVPMQMLKLPATHYLELKLRLKSKISDIEKERIEKLAKQEIQGCMDTFIHSFKYLEETFIYETIINWSNIIFEEADSILSDDIYININNNYNNNLIKNYSLIIVRLFDIYIPYFLQELIHSDYWDLKMIQKNQYDVLIKSLITIDKYMLIIKNWLEFNIDVINIQAEKIDKLMLFNQNDNCILNNNSFSESSINDQKIKEMMRKRYLNEEKSIMLFSLLIPQYIELIQNRINNIEYLVYQVYKNTNKSDCYEWTTGINVPNIYTSSVMIDISTIVNTGIESLLEWMNLPLDEESLTLILTPIMKFYRDITNFIINTIRKELSSKKYELLLTYIHYITDIILVLYKNGVSISTNSINNSISSDLKSLVKLHNIHKLLLLLNNNGNNNRNDNNNNSDLKDNVDINHNHSKVNGSNSNSRNNFNILNEHVSSGSFNYLFSSSNNNSFSNSRSDINNSTIVGLMNEKYDKNGIFYSLLLDCINDNTFYGIKSGNISNNVEKNENNDVKYLVSIHNLHFFKNTVLETSRKIKSLVFNRNENGSQNKYTLLNNSLKNLKKILEYLRNYGAMDNNENKLLNAVNSIELNNLLFSCDNSLGFDTNTDNNNNVNSKQEQLFLNVVNECISNINKFIISVININTVMVMSNNYGFEFFLRLYNNSSFIKNMEDNDLLYQINNSKMITIENIIQDINNYFRYFITQCPFYKEHQDDSECELEEEYNKSHINVIILLWLNQLFELYLKGTKYTELINIFENDFEILDELRRSYSVSDSINKDKNYRLSDLILYFITQIFPNKKISQNRIFKELTNISLISFTTNNSNNHNNDSISSINDNNNYYNTGSINSKYINIETKNKDGFGIYGLISSIKNITNNIDNLIAKQIEKGNIYTGLSGISNNNSNSRKTTDNIVSKIIKNSNRKKSSHYIQKKLN